MSEQQRSPFAGDDDVEAHKMRPGGANAEDDDDTGGHMVRPGG